MSGSSTQRRQVISLRRHLPLPFSAVVAALRADPAGVVSPAPERDEEGAEATTLTLSATVAWGVELSRTVRVHLGPLLEDDDGAVALPLWWEAAEHPSLFPTLDGGLEVRSVADGTELCLLGSYRPPLGRAGAYADAVVGHRLALVCLKGFLADTAERLAARAAVIPTK
jgi:hypothetical protein